MVLGQCLNRNGALNIVLAYVRAPSLRAKSLIENWVSTPPDTLAYTRGEGTAGPVRSGLDPQAKIMHVATLQCT